MFDHIVVPLDGSELSEVSLSYVAPLARKLGSKVVLLSAENDPYVEMFGGGSSVPQYMMTSEGQSMPTPSMDYLNNVCDRLASQGVRCEACVAEGAPAAAILRYIHKHCPDLVAMSTHGRSGMRRFVVGSITSTVLPRAGTAVLIVHPREGESVPPTTFENIIIPLDMSERSENALPTAASLTAALELNPTLVTCIPPTSRVYIGSVPALYPYPDDLIRQAQESSDSYLQTASESMRREHGIEVNRAVLEGGPAGAIVAYAQSKPNSLIVMSTQGRTGLGRWVLGSVTDSVIRTGNIPVLVIPHPDEHHR
ncbi:MAG: universal stress protein [Chloroflexi bacterium]|nr:universal stress protein [Chloroflexota bacterium]